MNTRRYTQILLFWCWMGLSTFVVSAKEQYYGSYGGGLFFGASVSIEEMIPQTSISGNVIRLSSEYDLRDCQLALYEWANGWRRYPRLQSDSEPLQVAFQGDEWFIDWAISLERQQPLTFPFAVLVIESLKMDALPEFTDTLAKIDHLGHGVRTRLFQGDLQQHSSSLTAQEDIDHRFSVHELLISMFLRELNERRQLSSPSEHAFVLVLGAVNYPDMYEVNRKFDFSSILETAKGYKEQDAPHNRHFPSSVEIIRNITQEAQNFVIPYRAWKQNPEQYEFFLEDGDILYVPGSF